MAASDGMSGPVAPLPELAFIDGICSPPHLEWLASWLKTTVTNHLPAPDNSGWSLMLQHLGAEGPKMIGPDGDMILIPFGPVGMTLDQWWKEISHEIPRRLLCPDRWSVRIVPTWAPMRRMLDSWHIRPAMSPFPQDSSNTYGIDPDVWDLLHAQEDGPWYSPYFYYVLLPQLEIGLDDGMSEADWWIRLKNSPDLYHQIQNYASDWAKLELPA